MVSLHVYDKRLNYTGRAQCDPAATTGAPCSVMQG